MRLPLKEVKLQHLVEASDGCFKVIVNLLEANHLMRTQMPECADHLMRRVFFDTENETFCYEPGNEPRMKIELN